MGHTAAATQSHIRTARQRADTLTLSHIHTLTYESIDVEIKKNTGKSHTN